MNLNDKQIGEDIIQYSRKKFPDLELYQIGALFLSIGSYLIAVSIPGLQDQLKQSALLAEDLLNQEELMEKNKQLNSKTELT